MYVSCSYIASYSVSSNLDTVQYILCLTVTCEYIAIDY